MKPTDKPEIDPQQQALAKRWGSRLERALKDRTTDKLDEKLKKRRKYVRGDVGDDGQGGLVRTNIIHSNFAAILPQIYAKNPEISVSPSESATDDAYPWVGSFCKTMQAVLNKEFVSKGRLKKRVKAAIRSTMTTSIGWMKVSWQEDVRTDPLLENRISDTQDNLQRIESLLRNIEEDQRGDVEAQQAEVTQQLEALKQQAEVKSVVGMVLDRVLTEDVFILDDTITDFDAYDQAESIAHRVWMTCDAYEQQFGKKPPKTATKYGKDKSERMADKDVQLVAVFEVWDKTSNTVYTLCAGADEWSRDPFIPEMGERFYPFFGLAFNPVDGRFEPLSDAELLMELQDEYNTTRTNFADHRKENLPVRAYRKGGDLTDSDISALSNRKSGEWIGIEGNPDQPIDKDIAILSNPPVSPMDYDVQPILRDAEMVLGASDASKGTVNKAKTATEAEIMAQGLQSRVAERQDVVEDWIAEMAQYSAEILLQKLSMQQVQAIAGKKAVWPQMSKEQIFDLVQIEIRAGSTGKPNQNREREQWIQMLPQIQQAVAQVAQLRAQGQNDMADTTIKLLEETLRRFDERIDIETFIPKQQEQAQPQIPPEMQQQMQQLQQAHQEMQAENEQLKQDAQAKTQEVEAKRAATTIDAETQLEIAKIKAQAEYDIQIAIAKMKMVFEREKMAMEERCKMREIAQAPMVEMQEMLMEPNPAMMTLNEEQ